jgi:RHS repeat-associated protein
MNRIIQRLRLSAASLLRAAGVLALLLALDARAGNYCNNPVPPCDPDNPASVCYRPDDPPPKCEPRVCGKCTKSPCYVGSGAYVRDETDLNIAGVGMPIDVSRHYQSTRMIDGETGYGWTSSLSARLHYAVYLKSAPSTYSKEVDIRMPDGALYRFVENADGSFTPPAGRFDTLVQNPDGTFDLWLQRTSSHLHFAANGNLLSLVDDFGNTQTWTYASGQLSRVEDSSGSGRYIDITYGADGRISDITDMTGRNVHYVYNASGVLTSVTNPASQTTAYGYTAGKYAPLLTSVTDHWGRNVTTIVRDTKDRVLSYTENGETFSYTYNSGTTSKSDSSGNTWQYPFGSGGLVSDSQPPGGGSAEHTDYYASGLVQTHTDAVGVKTNYTYNARGNIVTMTNDYQGATAVEWRVVYDPNFPDQAISVKPYNPSTGALHQHWQGATFEYYQSGSAAPGALYRRSKLDSDGTTAHVDWTFTYDTHGRVLTAEDAAGGVTELTYDSSGNLIEVEFPANNDAGTRPATTYTYDSLGRVLTETDAEGNTTTYTWDVLDRPLTVTLPKPVSSSPLVFTTAYHYDEFDSGTQLLFVRAVDANNRTTKIGFNAYGQVVQNVDELGNIVRNTYNKGLFASQIDANNNAITYAYDSRRRLSTVTFPDGTYEQFTYNADDTVATKRNRSNQIVTLTYDRHKRVTVKAYPNGGSISQTFQGEKLTQVIDTFASPSETHTYAYDDSFRVTANAQAGRGTVNYTYATNGRLATVSPAGGPAAAYDYYADGTVRTITWGAVSGTFRYDYNLNGQTTALTFPNGQTRTFTYDDQSRPTSVVNTHPTTGTLASFTYGYDVDPFTAQANMLGMRTSITATVPAIGLSSAVTNLGYNNRYELIRADYPSTAPYNSASASWTYDAAGHRASATLNGSTASYVYNKFNGNTLNSVQLQSDGGNAYTYDGEGNVTARSGSRGSFTFSWDYENRLRTVGGDTTASYLYDYDGRRTMKTVGGASTTFLFDEQNPIAEGGATSAQYLFGPQIDEPLAMVRGGSIYYYGIDGSDSVITLNDAAGAVQNSYAWDIWGTALGATQNVINPFGYTARDFAEAGLQYNRARYYEPAVGRFTAEDPLQELMPISGGELYGYVRNSPAMYTDPSGLECYSWSSRGPWNLVKSDPGEKWWTLVEAPEQPAVPPRRIPIGGGRKLPIPWPVGTRYTCYWREWQRFTNHYERNVMTTYACTCPVYVFTRTSIDRKSKTEVHKIRDEKVSVVNKYCSFSPPK